MRTIHLDGAAGVTGTMWLGALVEAGASLEAAQDAVDTLGVGNVRITIGKVRRAGQPATSVRIRAPEQTPPVGSWPAIRGVLGDAALEDAVRRDAVNVLARLAEAEARVSGVRPEQLTYIEVEALDTLAEVVATCAALRALDVERVTIGPVAVGSGTVESALGSRRVPSPVVTALLEGFTVVDGGLAGELTTPEGAALLAALAQPVTSAPLMRLEAAGVGAGARDLARPYVLRIQVGQAPVSSTS